MTRAQRRLIYKRIVGCTILLAVLIVTPFMVAYFSGAATFNNRAQSGNYKVYIDENFMPVDDWTPGVSVKKEAQVKNDGTSDVIIRLKVKESATDRVSGTDLPLVVTDSGEEIPVVDKAWTESFLNDWVYNESDGYYYYSKVLKSGTATPLIIESCTLSSLVSCDGHGAYGNYGNMDYKLEFVAESVQVEGAEKISVLWDKVDSATVADNGNINWGFK